MLVTIRFMLFIIKESGITHFQKIQFSQVFEIKSRL